MMFSRGDIVRIKDSNIFSQNKPGVIEDVKFSGDRPIYSIAITSSNGMKFKIDIANEDFLERIDQKELQS